MMFDNLFKKIKIVNVKGSADAWPKSPDNDDWIQYYKDHYDITVSQCAVDGSRSEKLEGGHVFKVSDLKAGIFKVYLVPLCPECNNPANESEMEVSEFELLDISQICPFNDVKKENKEIVEKYKD